ncbi:IS630 transposase-related protein [Leptolyngbya sp. DQ-M1]|uniref:IS630 transposase-related protein n=1 Tax=Leptolyngbya sp. DQ-M1 TaxID=2933920 RepID=UPI003298F1FB
MAALDRGVPKSEVIQMFNISRDSLERWLKRRSETGSFQATQGYPQGSSHRIVDREAFRAFVKRQGDKTQVELAELWHDRVSSRTISRALAKIRFTRKKDLRLSRTG